MANLVQVRQPDGDDLVDDLPAVQQDEADVLPRQLGPQMRDAVVEEGPPGPRVGNLAPHGLGSPLHQIQVAGRAVVVARIGSGAQQLVEGIEPAAVGSPLEVRRAVRDDRSDLGFGQLIKPLGAQGLQGGEPALLAGEQPAVLEELVGRGVDAQGGDLRTRRIAEGDHRRASGYHEGSPGR